MAQISNSFPLIHEHKYLINLLGASVLSSPYVCTLKIHFIDMFPFFINTTLTVSDTFWNFSLILLEISERLLLHCSWVCLQRRHLKQRILIWKFFSIPSVLYSNSVSELHSMSPIWTASWPHTSLVFRITAGSLLAKCRHVDSWVKTEVKGVSEERDGVKRKWDKSLGKGCYGIWPINLMWRAGCLLPVQ